MKFVFGPFPTKRNFYDVLIVILCLIVDNKKPKFLLYFCFEMSTPLLYTKFIFANNPPCLVPTRSKVLLEVAIMGQIMGIIINVLSQADPICVGRPTKGSFFFQLENIMKQPFFRGRRNFGWVLCPRFWPPAFWPFLISSPFDAKKVSSTFQAQRDPLENLRLAVERAEAAGVEEDELGS